MLVSRKKKRSDRDLMILLKMHFICWYLLFWKWRESHGSQFIFCCSILMTMRYRESMAKARITMEMNFSLPLLLNSSVKILLAFLLRSGSLFFFLCASFLLLFSPWGASVGLPHSHSSQSNYEKKTVAESKIKDEKTAT